MQTLFHIISRRVRDSDVALAVVVDDKKYNTERVNDVTRHDYVVEPF
jgi:hypothetical protein